MPLTRSLPTEFESTGQSIREYARDGTFTAESISTFTILPEGMSIVRRHSRLSMREVTLLYGLSECWIITNMIGWMRFPEFVTGLRFAECGVWMAPIAV